MLSYSAVLILGLVLLIWSADKFVDEASLLSSRLGMSPLLIGMLIIGFGTSAPEMVVSAISALKGNPGLALGNAFGSNITNIALVVGFTACFCPIVVDSKILKKELPILTLFTFGVVYLLSDFELSRQDAFIILISFAILMSWTIYQGLSKPEDSFADSVEEHVEATQKPLYLTIFSLIFGISILLLSSRALVWGAVGLAQSFGISDVIIGLTVVAIGTSLPELASSYAAAKKGQSDMVIGNVLGSNLFNTLAVVGIAGIIHPLQLSHSLIYRDAIIMTALTLSLFVLGYSFKKPWKINFVKGVILLLVYIAYTSILIQYALNTRSI